MRYVVTPAEVNGTATKGADDYLAAGGSLEGLLAAGSNRPPSPEAASDAFTDARLAEVIADEAFADRYVWVPGLGWLKWDGCRWLPVSEREVVEAVRRYGLGRHREAFEAMAAGDPRGRSAMDGWKAALSKGRLTALVTLASGIVLRNVADFDQHPELLNTPSGVVNLRTGELGPHDPDLLLTKITAVGYRPGAEHPDWAATLKAIPAEVRPWAQLRFGAALIGEPPSDDLSLFLVGSGENGKTTVTGAIGAALGDYFVLVSDRVVLGDPRDHPTELMALRGARFALVEETPEARQLNVARLKKIVGTPEIAARLIRQDAVTFKASHALFISTNYLPVVAETDHGTWRRLALLRFPYRFAASAAPGDATARPLDRMLRHRVKTRRAAQEAVLAWLVEGARQWFEAGQVVDMPTRVAADTRAWRAESDQILGFITEHLAFDAESHVQARELLSVFNEWLTERGSRPWTEKLFASRFADHSEIVAHGVEKAKIRKRPGLSRGPSPLAGVGSVPAMYAAYLGVRFAEADEGLSESGPGHTENGSEAHTAPDQGKLDFEHDHVPGVTAPPVNPGIDSPTRFTGTAVTPGTNDLDEDPDLAVLPVVELAHSVLTADVYEAIAAEPTITLKALSAELDLSVELIKVELERLTRAGAISRRRGRGFDVLARITETVREYVPCADPGWVNTTGPGRDEPDMRRLLKFQSACGMCGEPDDGESIYFPVCAECRQVAGEVA